MQRRDFIKITAAGGAAAALEGCGNPDHQLIRFIPEEELLPGIATWKPSICTMCPAGCGTLVRVMQGEAEVVRNGQLGIIKMGLAKKIEGNPAHPINQGKLCPRGQASLQVTYHPDRIRTPLQRAGERGAGQWKEITWDDAIKQLVGQLSPLQSSHEAPAVLTPPLRGVCKAIVETFAKSLGGVHTEFAFFDCDVVRQANSDSFGHFAMPSIDLGRSNYVVSFGADFLGTWNSPVAQSIGYGHMRKGRAGQRGKFVQFESRVSQTGANADEWIACPPGSEGAIALSLAHVIINEKLQPFNGSGVGIDGWTLGLPDFTPERIEQEFGVAAAVVIRIAREAAANSPAAVLIGGSASAQSNGLFNTRAVNALNALLGSVGKPGGISFAPRWNSKAVPTPNDVTNAAADLWLQKPTFGLDRPPKVALLGNANPVFANPVAYGSRDELSRIPFIASFGCFLDETSILADLVLPDHSPLESWLDDTPESGSTRAVVSVAPPVMAPLHNTRSMPDVLLEVAQQLGGDVGKALPWKTYQDALQAAFADLHKQYGSNTAKDADEFWTKAKDQGGWWSVEGNVPLPEAAKARPQLLKVPPQSIKYAGPQFDGDPAQFPFHFLPFASQMFYDGSLAHLPWMQEAPDPLSSVMWGTWVEINTRTAEKLGVKMGDTVEVASQHGSLRAPALVTPAIAPDVIAMPIGQGHTNYTRYATNRGANPISILAPMTVEATGSLAWAATRVKVSRVGEGKIVMFGASMEETPPSTKHR
jgi:menaquinone reductase, molybdopterin-binding-like subunit